MPILNCRPDGYIFLMSCKKITRFFLKKRFIIILLASFLIVFLFASFFIKKISFEYVAFSEGGENSQPGLAENKIVHVKTPDHVRGIYMTSWVASTKNLRENLVKIIDSTEINSVVIDIKDYTGKISFFASSTELQKIGSMENRIKDIKEFMEELHDKNIYVIGRIAVFQDPYMVKIRPDLAVKRSDGETPWRDYKGMPWLDQCSKEVWDYTIEIARESERLGFDELNFDYIRFPSDGNMRDIKYSFCDSKSPKEFLLEQFFDYLKNNLEDLDIPLSADLFGMVTTNTDDLNIGQVLEKAEPYFDYISPMVYPSHYPKGFNGFSNPAAKPYEVIKMSMDVAAKRLAAASSTPSKLRPWLQDFNLGAVYDAGMIRKQKQAVYDAGLGSWLMWSPSNKYTVGAFDK